VGEVKTAASLIGLQFEVVNASTSREIDAAFATLAPRPPSHARGEVKNERDDVIPS
jgi:hypothetical protein